MDHFTGGEISSYAKNKNIAPGVLLWATNVPLAEEAFRSGAKNSACANFLRWKDIDLEESKGPGRIPEEEWELAVIEPGQGLSLFIKRMIPMASIYLGDSLEKAKVKELKNEFDPVNERFWWKIEAGQLIPAGLQLIYDGVPPGHCTLTVEREMTVGAFLKLASLITFVSVGVSYYGKPR